MKDTIINNNTDTGQWPQMNTANRICYDLSVLKQIKDVPLSKDKPEITPKLEACDLMRNSPLPDHTFSLASISRPLGASFLPTFVKTTNVHHTPKDFRKDEKRMVAGGNVSKGGIKTNMSPNVFSPHKSMIKVSLVREDVKLNETENAWKLSRFKREKLDDEEQKTQELYKKFRGILNKLTPEKFDTLMDKIKDLEIDTQQRLEGVIDLVFEKAIYEPKYSKAYAVMCNRLSKLKVPVANASSPGQCVYFRALLISRCQAQFVTNNVDEKILSLEKEVSECNDPQKKKELQAQLNEENTKVRLRSVGNVRFIGELYKMNMLTPKIMMYCMQYLVDKIEEEKLECLCKLLTTIGEQIEGDVKGELDIIFKKMQELVDRKTGISSRVRFMLQDVIALRKRKWFVKSVVDLQPKTMDQIQREADQQQRHIEIMNATPMRRDGGNMGGGGGGGGGGSGGGGSGGRLRRGERRPPPPPAPRTYSVDTTKLKAVTNKNLSTIKLAPQNAGWNRGAGLRTPTGSPAGLATAPPVFTNKYSLLADDAAEPPPLPARNTMGPAESTSRSRSRSTGRVKSTSPTRSFPELPALVPESEPQKDQISEPEPEDPEDPETAEPEVPEMNRKTVSCIIEQHLINFDDDEVVAEVKEKFPPAQHAAVIVEIVNVALEKSSKDMDTIAKSIVNLVSSKTISEESLHTGLKEIMDLAPDLYIDIPKLYDYLAVFLAPLIENEHLTLATLCDISKCAATPSGHGGLLLRAVLKLLAAHEGEAFALNQWRMSDLTFNQWMNDDQAATFIEDNNLHFLKEPVITVSSNLTERTDLNELDIENRLLALMESGKSCDHIFEWLKSIGEPGPEQSIARALVQAVCRYGFDHDTGEPFDKVKLQRYVELLKRPTAERLQHELDCFIGVQQLMLRMPDRQDALLRIIEYLHEESVVSMEAFAAYEDMVDKDEQTN